MSATDPKQPDFPCSATARGRLAVRELAAAVAARTRDRQHRKLVTVEAKGAKVPGWRQRIAEREAESLAAVRTLPEIVQCGEPIFSTCDRLKEIEWMG